MRKEFWVHGKKFFLETGKLAIQADGAVVCGCGDTWVLCTAVYAREPKKEANFFPLSVNYMEKFSAFGKIPGGYLKRESKPSDAETLISRLIDRPIRPTFPDNFYNEVQIICTLLSYDKVNDPEMIALIGASAAIRLSGLPVLHTIAGVKVGFIDNKFIVNPTHSEIISKENKLNLVIAGTKTSVSMVESEAHELQEDQMLEAITLGHKACSDITTAIDEFTCQIGKQKIEVQSEMPVITDIKKQIRENFSEEILLAYQIFAKKERYAKLDEIRNRIREKFADTVAENGISTVFFENAIFTVESEIVRKMVVVDQKRIDGRKFNEVRKLHTEISVLPRVHGSALFMRGETQALVTTTLGATTDVQMWDSRDGLCKDQFMLHYNFPPFSVNETSPMRGPGRREIGHGNLALRAIRPVLDLENCPYTIRVISDIISCNGSSSMATICGASLSLMDAGINLKKPVAGIAMGLIKEGSDYVILTDIMADEDHLGDMDFKVGGTADGITALQMDIKIDGISEEIIKQALSQARDARLHILEHMGHLIKVTKSDVNKFAPKIVKFNIPVGSIGDVIGKGGANIKHFSEEFACKIEIAENGLITLFAENEEQGEKARGAILFSIADLEIGKTYTGTVIEVRGFGAMVKLPGNKQGMIHISEITDHRIEDINDYITAGDIVDVKYLGTDEKRRVKLSAKASGLKSKSGNNGNNVQSEENHNHNSNHHDVKENPTKQENADNNAESDGLIKKRFSSESAVDMLVNNDNVYSN